VSDSIGGSYESDSSIANENTVFHQETSDNYFTNQRNNDKFDLIFLDGFHESKQTFRDFINSINFICNGSKDRPVNSE
jgi:hypothetical protein